MNYELAKQLKDAGFPQGTGLYYLDDKRHANGPPDFVEHFVADYEAKDTKDCTFAYVPTLEELIEACGYGFDFLKQYSIPQNISWGAGYMYEGKGVRASGATPTEAVARLWRALNTPKTT